MIKHSQISQNRKLVVFFAMSQEKNIEEVYFLHAEKHESFLQVDYILINYFKADTVLLGRIQVKKILSTLP